jgi:hypothetical protein
VIAAGVLTLSTITGFAYLFSLWAGGTEISPQQTLRLASAQYVAGNPVVAGELAASVSLENAVTDDLAEEGADAAAVDTREPPSEEEIAKAEEADRWLSLQSFLIGAGVFEKSTGLDSPRGRREELKKAIPSLKQSETLGFPEGRESDGHRMLGLALHGVGDYDAATDHLQRAIDKDITLKAELMPVLAVAQARRPREDLNEAIQAINTYLASDSLDAQQRTDANLLRIDWLIQLQRFDEADAALKAAREVIAPSLEQQLRWALAARDELMLKQAELVIEKTLAPITRAHGERAIAGIPAKAHKQVAAPERAELLEMIKELTSLQREASPALASRSRLTAAHAYLLASERELALAELTQLRQQRPFGEEGLEGGLSEIELLADQGRGAEVLQTTRYIVREMGQSRHLNYTSGIETELRTRMAEVLGILRSAKEFQAVIEIADALESLFGTADAAIEKGVAYRDWGSETLNAGRGRGDEISREAFAAARARFRGAGDAFALAAEQQFDTKGYVPTLWLAIDSYQRGRHFSKSIPLLEQYLRYEDRMKQPAGLVAHGRALLAEGRPKEAMESLQTCIVEFERDPMHYEARLLAAQAAADAHDGELAKSLLNENLTDGKLTPQSPVWRDSLFTLAELLYAECDSRTLNAMTLPQEKKVAELRAIEPELMTALQRLDETVKRAWPLPRAQATAYLLARGQLLASRLPEAELENESVLEAAQRDLRQKANRYRQAALDQFTSMVRFMDAEQREDDLSEKQDAILRNSLLGQADTLKAMQRYAEAADAYRDMSLRYMNEPPALEALLGQSRMVRLMGRNREADLLVAQAVVVLDRIGEQWDDKFDEMTRFSREDWRTYLSWMNKRLDQAKARSETVRQ